MKIVKFPNNFNKLDIIEKKNYVKELLSSQNIDTVVNSLIINNSNIIENMDILNSISRTKVYKNNTKLSYIELVSKTINLYIKNNKTKELQKYIATLEENKIKKIIDYEVKNKTDFSKLKICKNLIKKYNKKNIEPGKIKKSLETDNQDNIRHSKKRFSVLFIILILFLIVAYSFTYYCYRKIVYYNSHIYPNIYLDNELLSDKDNSSVIELLNSKDNIKEENIIFKNENDEFSYTYENIGYSTNKDELVDKIINSYKSLNGYQKLYKIFFDNKQEYNFNYILDESKYEVFLNDLRSKVNVNKKEESFYISNGVINYKKGINGFLLDDQNIKSEIEKSLRNNQREINLTGSIDSTDNILGLINKKVSTFTTYYNESQGRAVNIRNAVKKLNGKIIYSGETFSFYRTVGPYNGSRGFIFYGKDVGSGVCQVSTTIYNAALLLNLPIVYRENHGDMVYYVDYGLDATVYGSSVDMKFRNNSKYPIYVEASASGGTLTVNLWSNENIVSPGYSYKPRVESLGGLSFKTYIDTYHNGEFVSSKYLNSSYYLKGK
ncbi:MAG: VanW family protein [Bacilli bacterium]|nr:VanW family protein [Bacilli bacterium]